MSTTSKAYFSKINDTICQGDIFKNVKYSYIEKENDDSVNIIEFEFPYAVIISQACDVIAMENLLANHSGKATKFMPSVLFCPIYEKSQAKSGAHLSDIFSELSISTEAEGLYQKDDYNVAKRDWHYRFHALEISAENVIVLENAILDFKHYFSLPMSYLLQHKEDRILHLDDIFAEQITLKFATYLSRVAIPD